MTSSFSYYSVRKDPPLDPAYTQERAIVGKRLTNPRAEKLCVLLPGWHNSSKRIPLRWLVKRLSKRGWAILVYDFHPQILEADEKMVVESFRHIQASICEDLDSLTARRGYKKVHLLGISLGSVACSLVADGFKGFTGATLVVGGDDLAIDMWHGTRSQILRRDFQKLHVGIRKLDKDWRYVAPVNHLKNFSGKPVTMVLATADKVIRTEYQKRLAERLKENGAELLIRKNHLGHVLTVVRFCLLGKVTE